MATAGSSRISSIQRKSRGWRYSRRAVAYLREFNEAYRISKRPALLYNIARCFEALEKYSDAVNMLQRYLEEEPQTTDRAAVETRIANLKERQAAAARVHRTPSEPPETKPAPPQPLPPRST